jgi:tight adherence protein B
VIAAPPVDGGDSGTWLLVAGAVCVFLAISGFVLAMVGTPSRRQRRGRLHWGGDRAATSSSSKTGVGDRLTALADDVLVRTGKRGGLAYALDVGAVALRPGEFVVLVVAGMVTAAAVLFALIGPIGALLGAVAVPFVSMAVVRTRIDRRRRRFDEQLPDLLQLVVGALRSGFALPQALDVVANQAAEPAGTEFRRVMFESRVGRDLTESLQGVADRMRSTPFEWVVSAIDINREVGGELAAVLETAAKTVRERQQHERQVLTLTAEGRLSAYVVTALPFVVFLAIGLTNPDYLEPLTESPGPALLGFCGVLLLVGWFWMRRLVRTELS